MTRRQQPPRQRHARLDRPTSRLPKTGEAGAQKNGLRATTRVEGDDGRMSLTEEDISALVEVFLILDRWKREDEERAAGERGE
jgi:hypothetical protein